MARNAETQSPIKRRPLPTAGRSLDRRVSEAVYETCLLWGLFLILALLMTLWEWAGYLFDLPRSPWPFTLLGIIVLALAAWRVPLAWRKAKRLALGRQGEMEVGHLLEHLRAHGYQVFHDLPGDAKASWNIDHALVGPGGVFAIETKTVSMLKGRKNIVTYDGDTVRINGHTPDRDPLAQARGSAARIREVLRETTGHEVAVHPVVVYPGWWIEGSSSGKPVWVLNPKALVDWLQNENPRLRPEDAALYASRLAMYVRGVEEALYG